MKSKPKKRIGQKIVDSLQEFVSALESGADLQEFTSRHVEVNLAIVAYDPQVVQRTRKTLRASQSLFARFLGVSVQTVRAWEQGDNVPSDIAKRFMDEIRHNPDYWRARLKEVVIAKARRPKYSVA